MNSKMFLLKWDRFQLNFEKKFKQWKNQYKNY